MEDQRTVGGGFEHSYMETLDSSGFPNFDTTSEQGSEIMQKMVDHDLLFRILLHPRAYLKTSRIKRGLGWTTNAWISSVEGPVRPKWVRDCDPFTEL
jgi:hypothetical protein